MVGFLCRECPGGRGFSSFSSRFFAFSSSLLWYDNVVLMLLSPSTITAGQREASKPNLAVGLDVRHFVRFLALSSLKTAGVSCLLSQSRIASGEASPAFPRHSTAPPLLASSSRSLPSAPHASSCLQQEAALALALLLTLIFAASQQGFRWRTVVLEVS